MSELFNVLLDIKVIQNFMILKFKIFKELAY